MAPSAIALYPEDVDVVSKLSGSHHQKAGNFTEWEQRNGQYAKSLVHRILREHISRINVDECEAGEEDAFYVADLGEVYRQHLRWKNNLARVKPFYAVKCNPDREVLRLLAQLGTGFDCASKAEIDLVLSLGVAPDRIIYAHPCKTKSYLRHAARVGVNMMTFDNHDELYKIRACHPNAELVLRIATDDSESMCQLSVKYGASLKSAESLLQLARNLDLNVVGVSFHVGSGAGDPMCYPKALQDARLVFDQAGQIGFELTLIDIGGGFQDETFELFAEGLRESVDELFPPHVRVIGEPGRYYAAKAFTLAANVIARREVRNEAYGESSYMLYLNDGVYGNFSNIIFDHQHPVAEILHTASRSKTMTEYSIWGPTCDGIDVISKRCRLPGTVDVGDWLLFEEMGAYTSSSSSQFNGFPNSHEVIYVSSEPGASALLGY